MVSYEQQLVTMLSKSVGVCVYEFMPFCTAQAGLDKKKTRTVGRMNLCSSACLWYLAVWRCCRHANQQCLLLVLVVSSPMICRWKRSVFDLSPRDYIPNVCEHDVLQNAPENFNKFTRWVQLTAKMNWLDFQVKRSQVKVKVTVRPCMVKSHCSKTFPVKAHQSTICHRRPFGLFCESVNIAYTRELNIVCECL